MTRPTISQMIEHDLRQRILKGDALPTELSLRGLSRHYRVSEMPVRTAVNTLVEEGVLCRGENNRLSLPSTQSEVAREPGEPELTEHPIASGWDGRELREAIIRMSLSGKGQYLREASAADQYGVGRTVIRRVLSSLAGEGLVEHVPRRGWWVHEYEETDLLQYLAVREVLELKAMELAFPLMEHAELEALIKDNSGELKGRHAALDNRLHAYWIELSGNRYIVGFFRQRGAFYAALLEHAGHTEINVARMAGQHRRILSELLAENLHGAQTALSEHIQAQHPTLLRMIQKLQDSASQASDRL